MLRHSSVTFGSLSNFPMPRMYRILVSPAPRRPHLLHLRRQSSLPSWNRPAHRACFQWQPVYAGWTRNRPECLVLGCLCHLAPAQFSGEKRSTGDWRSNRNSGPNRQPRQEGHAWTGLGHCCLLSTVHFSSPLLSKNARARAHASYELCLTPRTYSLKSWCDCFEECKELPYLWCFTAAIVQSKEDLHLATMERHFQINKNHPPCC